MTNAKLGTGYDDKFAQMELGKLRATVEQQQAEVERLTIERDYWHNACAFAIEQRKPLEKELEAKGGSDDEVD